MPGPLAQVTGFSIFPNDQTSAAVAAMVLADLGAEVIRVEPQGSHGTANLPGCSRVIPAIRAKSWRC